MSDFNEVLDRWSAESLQPESLSSMGVRVPALTRAEQRLPDKMGPLVKRLGDILEAVNTNRGNKGLVMAIIASWPSTFADMRDDAEVVALFKSDLDYINKH